MLLPKSEPWKCSHELLALCLQHYLIMFLTIIEAFVSSKAEARARKCNEYRFKLNINVYTEKKLFDSLY